MKLCYVAPGRSVHTERWLSAFVERGHQVHLIALPGEEASIEGVTIHRLSEGRPKMRFVSWTLAARRILRTVRPDILHGHYLTRYGWLAAASLFRPLVLTAWGTDAYLDPPRSRATRLLTGWALRRAALVTADADDLRRQVVRLGAAPRRVQVVQWGVDTTLFRPDLDASELRQRLRLGEAPVILSTRALAPNYRQDVILRALPAVLSVVPDAVLVLKYHEYDQAYLERLRALTGELHLERAVRFVGGTPYAELAAYYALADVFVSVARSDGTPVSLLEAMACGAVPVVGDLPALREWVTDGENGFCVPGGDTAALGGALVRLLVAPKMRTQFARRNRDIIRERADHAGQMGRMEQLYVGLTERRK